MTRVTITSILSQTLDEGDQRDETDARPDQGQSVTVLLEGRLLADPDRIIEPRKEITFIIGEADVSGIALGNGLMP